MSSEQAFPQRSGIVYQCYGNEGIYCECAFSLLSLINVYAGQDLTELEIHIYTDAPEWFQRLQLPLNLIMHPVDNDILKQWRGSINFVHRVKIALLQDVLRTGIQQVLYVDTDVVFTQKIDTILQQIAAGKVYMHVMEGVISQRGNPIMAKLCQYLDGTRQQQSSGAPLSQIALWNAGVLGFSAQQGVMLQDVLQYTDHHYPHFKKHIVEQFAFSMRLAHQGYIHTAAPYMIHYWNLKEARPLLLSFFKHYAAAGIRTMLQYAPLIQMPVLMQEKANYYGGRSIAHKLAKKTWQPVIPDWLQAQQQLAD